MNNLTHVDSNGKALMVDVSGKNTSDRQAVAKALVLMKKETFNSVKNNTINKGDVLTAAKLAAIQAAKKTSELIPLCHNIFISSIDISFLFLDSDNSIEITAIAKTNSVTGIEMEALTAVAVAGLTIYDMCKAIDKSIIITDIELIAKSGGKVETIINQYIRIICKMDRSGRVVAISVSSIKGIPKSNISQANLITNHGIENDAHAGNWHRQVSLLAIESIEKMRTAGLDYLLPGAFAENITTQYLNLTQLAIGTKFNIGNAELEVTQIGKECHSRCAIFDTVGDCVMPREGIFAKVLKGGQIYINDIVQVIEFEK